jgi:hypothetical protein
MPKIQRIDNQQKRKVPAEMDFGRHFLRRVWGEMDFAIPLFP